MQASLLELLRSIRPRQSEGFVADELMAQAVDGKANGNPRIKIQ